jgi:phosphate starvation-inducible PhoH-like protein
MKIMNFFLLIPFSLALKNLKNASQLSSLFLKKEKSKFFDFIPNKYIPKNENQHKYINYLNNNSVNIVVAIGPAGTGKTMFACIRAIEMLKNKKLNKIVLTRPIIAVEEEELGFLPGNLVKKMDPWTRPILDIFMEYYSKMEIESMISNNIIEISPLAYMRGRTFKNALVIADEMQNSTPNQMLMLTTRLGLNSKLVITGDLKQTDRSKESNGLLDLINKKKIYDKFHNDTNDIEIIEFKKEDIERSEIVQKIINIYQFDEKNNNKEFSKLNNFKNQTTILSDAALIPLNKLPKKYS